jgi:hypothetical protein
MKKPPVISEHKICSIWSKTRYIKSLTVGVFVSRTQEEIMRKRQQRTVQKQERLKESEPAEAEAFTQSKANL